MMVEHMHQHGTSVRTQISNIYNNIINKITNNLTNFWINGDQTLTKSSGTYNQIVKQFQLQGNTRYTLSIESIEGNYKDNGTIQIFGVNDAQYIAGFFYTGRKYQSFTTPSDGIIRIHLFINTSTPLNSETTVTWKDIALVLGDKKIEPLKILPEVLPETLFNRMSVKGAITKKSSTLNANTNLILENPNIKTSQIIGCTFEFDTFSECSILTSNTTGIFGIMKLTVTNNKIKLSQYTTSWNVIGEYDHNLDIQHYLNININIKDNRTCTVTIGSYQGEESKELAWNYPGANNITFISATSSRNVHLNFIPNGLDRNVYAYGDSYFDIWPWNIMPKCTNLLLDGFGGRTSAQAYTSIERMLKIHTPNIILWCMGMNDPDSSSSINANYLTNITKIKDLCDANNILLIPITIPNTPTNNNTFKNQYIREHFERYVDIANAVGSETSTAWYNGLLGTDNLHPTTLGGKVIANRILSEVPEIQ